MRTLKSTAALVRAILETDNRARNSDSFLYFRIVDFIAKSRGMRLCDIPVNHFLLHRHEYGFPAFETVRRTRQKVQAMHPELAGDDKATSARKRKEAVFRKYAKELSE